VTFGLFAVLQTGCLFGVGSYPAEDNEQRRTDCSLGEVVGEKTPTTA
jgi:hypothetical protein